MPTRTARNRRRYTDAFRATALAALDANGGNLDRTARDLKMPRKTLDRWAKGRHSPELAQLRQEKKSDLADHLEALVVKLCRLDLSRFKNLNFRDAAVAVGIAIDKIILLRGREEERKPTESEGKYDLSRLTPSQLRQFADLADLAAGEPPLQYASDLNNPVVVPWAKEGYGAGSADDPAQADAL